MATEAKILITAQDQTRAAFASIQRNLAGLSSIVGGLSVGAVVAYTREVIAAASALDDMAEATGASVESLSRLTNIAKISGRDVAEVETAITRLTKALSGADDETRGAAEAFAAIGLKASELKALAPDVALETIARALNQFEDGAGKASVAIAIFGRAGAQLLPLLKDIAEDLGTAADVTGEQAAAAEKLEKDFARLQLRVESFGKAVLLNLVGPLLRAVDTFQQMQALYGTAGALSPGGLLRFSLRVRQQEQALAAGAGVDDSREFARAGVARRELPIVEGASSAARRTRALSNENDKLIAQYKEMLDAWNPLALRWEEDLQKSTELTKEQINQYVLAAEQVLGMDEAWLKYQEDIERAGGIVEQQTEDWRELGIVMTSAFEDAILEGKKFSEVLKGLADDLFRIVLRKTVTEPLAGAIGEIFKGFSLPGFATGGSFMVGGAGGTDSQLVAFAATPGERVTVSPSGAPGGAGVVVNMNISTPNAASFRASQGQVLSEMRLALARAGRNL